MQTIGEQAKLSNKIKHKNKTYECADLTKFKRVIYGMDDSGSPRVPGVGENADPILILTAYDRIGGFIKNEEGFKVLNGSFCNYKASRLKTIDNTVGNEKLEIILEARVNGTVYEWKEGEDVPWANLVNKSERKRGEKNKRVRVNSEKKEETKKVEDEKETKQPEKKAN